MSLLFCMYDMKAGKQGVRIDGGEFWWPAFRLPTIEVRRSAHVNEAAVRELMASQSAIQVR